MNTVIAKRSCDYKDCKEFRDKSNINPSVTFFGFPSDPERCKKWLILSQTTSVNPRFICSKHFEKIYISHSQRRIHLLTSAIPIDYKKTGLDQKNIKESQFQDNVEEESDIDILDKNFEFLYQNEILDYKKHDLNNLQQTKDHKLLNSLVSTPFTKRKLETSSVNYNNDSKKLTSTKKIKLVKNPSKEVSKVISQVILNKGQNTLDFEENKKYKCSEPEIEINKSNENVSSNELNDSNSKVTTLIIGGNEYIQMPKISYLKEKMALLNKIENYKRILKEFKGKLDNLDLI